MSVKKLRRIDCSGRPGWMGLQPGMVFEHDGCSLTRMSIGWSYDDGRGGFGFVMDGPTRAPALPQGSWPVVLGQAVQAGLLVDDRNLCWFIRLASAFDWAERPTELVGKMDGIEQEAAALGLDMEVVREQASLSAASNGAEKWLQAGRSVSLLAMMAWRASGNRGDPTDWMPGQDVPNCAVQEA